MDQLEGYVPDWSAERSSQLIGHLQTFSNELFAKIESLQTKTQETRFLAKDYHLKVKKDFHAVLAIADKQFMEHFGEESEKPEEASVSAEDQSQRVKDKLRQAGEISIGGCSRFIEQEGKVLAERGDRTARNSSMTSSSIFSSFRSDIKFPPIIDSKAYAGNKLLGLCTKGPAFQPPTSQPLASDSSSTQSQVSLVGDSLAESSTLQNIQIPTPSTATPQPARPGVIPPPPPIALLGKLAEQRKKEVAAGPTLASLASSQQPEEDDYSHLTSKQKLELALNRGQRPPASEDSPLNQSISQDAKKKSVLQASLFDGKKPTAGGFFDDDEDDGATLLQRSQAASSKGSQRPDPASQQPARQQANPYSLPPDEAGSMLDSILKKKTAPTIIDEANPFTRQPTKPKPSLFDREDDDEDEPVANQKKDKFKTLMNDDSDEEEKQKKLIQKYAGGNATPAAPADPKKKKNKLLEEDDQDQPAPTKKEKPPASKTKKFGFEDSEEDLPAKPAKPAPPTKQQKINKLLDDSDDPLPKPPARKNKLLEAEAHTPRQAASQPLPTPDPEAAPAQSKQKTPNPVPQKNQPQEDLPPRKPDLSSDEEVQASDSRPSVKNVDFMSRLSAQLGKGPKPGFGSVVKGDNDYLDPDIHGLANKHREEEDDPSLLKTQYRSQRNSIDQISAIKPVADRYFQQSDLGEEDRPAKKSKKNSLIIQDAPSAPENLSRPVDREDEAKPAFKKNKKPEQTNNPDEELPKPPQKPAPGPKPEDADEPPMLRGRKKKDPFANSSDDEPKKPAAPQKPVPQAPAPPQEEEPVMLRGKKKKDPFANSSDDEPKKPAAPQKSTPAQPAKPQEDEPVMLRGKKKKDPFDKSSGDELPQPPKNPGQPDSAKNPRSSEGKRKNRLLADGAGQAPEPAPPSKKLPAEPAKPAAKKKLLAESSEEEPAQRKAPQDRKKKLLADSDEEAPLPSKPAPKQAPAKGKKKLFDDSD